MTVFPPAVDAIRGARGDVAGPAGARIEVVAAKSGRPVARRDGVFVDSGYDPEKNARERADRLDLAGRRGAILFDDGFCYLARELAARGLAVLVVESDRSLARAGLAALGEEAWRSFGLVFADEIRGPAAYGRFVPADWQAADLVVIPARSGEGTAEATRHLAAFLRRRLVDLETTAWFGRRWLLNALDTLAARPGWLDCRPEVATGDWVIAGPGPGLDLALPRLVRDRAGYRLLALAPAVTRLLAAGLVPDLVATSDGGHAARLHLAGIVLPGVPLVLPLFAAAGMARAWAGPVFAVSQGTPFEGLLGGDLPVLPETPSVALFAFEAALACGAGRIILAGLDFASRGGKVHARGYRFDEDARDRSSRVAPMQRILDGAWRRGDAGCGDGWRADPKFALYRDGLLEAVARCGRPVLRTSGGPLLGMLPEAETFAGPGPAPAARPGAGPDRERLAALGGALGEAAREADRAPTPATLARFLADPFLHPLLQLLRPAEVWLAGRGEAERAAGKFFAGLAGDLARLARRLVI